MIKNLLKSSLFFIGFLFLQRLLYLGSFLNQWQSAKISDLATCVLAGLRFDLMTAGYCLLPFLFLSIGPIRHLLVKIELMGFIWKLLLAVILTLTAVIGTLDIQWTIEFADRFNSAHTMTEFISQAEFSATFVINFLAELAILVLLIAKLWHWKISWQPRASIFEWAVALFFVAMMIRGTIGPHHLDLRHAEVTESQFLNCAAITSPYALDQAERQRR